MTDKSVSLLSWVMFYTSSFDSFKSDYLNGLFMFFFVS